MVMGQMQGQAGMADTWVGVCINGVRGWAQAWLLCNSGGRQEPQLKSSSSGKEQVAPAELSQQSCLGELRQGQFLAFFTKVLIRPSATHPEGESTLWALMYCLLQASGG